MTLVGLERTFLDAKALLVELKPDVVVCDSRDTAMAVAQLEHPPLVFVLSDEEATVGAKQLAPFVPLSTKSPLEEIIQALSRPAGRSLGAAAAPP